MDQTNERFGVIWYHKVDIVNNRQNGKAPSKTELFYWLTPKSFLEPL